MVTTMPGGDSGEIGATLFWLQGDLHAGYRARVNVGDGRRIEAAAGRSASGRIREAPPAQQIGHAEAPGVVAAGPACARSRSACAGAPWRDPPRLWLPSDAMVLEPLAGSTNGCSRSHPELADGK
jgi:hypothetical protein